MSKTNNVIELADYRIRRNIKAKEQREIDNRMRLSKLVARWVNEEDNKMWILRQMLGYEKIVDLVMEWVENNESRAIHYALAAEQRHEIAG